MNKKPRSPKKKAPQKKLGQHKENPQSLPDGETAPQFSQKGGTAIQWPTAGGGVLIELECAELAVNPFPPLELPAGKARTALRNEDWQFAGLDRELCELERKAEKDGKAQRLVISLYELIRESDVARAVCAAYGKALAAYPLEKQIEDNERGDWRLDEKPNNTGSPLSQERAAYLEASSQFEELVDDFGYVGCPPLDKLYHFIAEDVPWLLLPLEAKELAIREAATEDTRAQDFFEPMPGAQVINWDSVGLREQAGVNGIGWEVLPVRIDWRQDDKAIRAGLKELLKRRPTEFPNPKVSPFPEKALAPFLRRLAAYRVRDHWARYKAFNLWDVEFNEDDAGRLQKELESAQKTFDKDFKVIKAIVRLFPRWWP